ncbi:amidoligase enzyme [Siphonobacter sp. BAB-5385]|uniref:amidoligase family protein n=1 Tax=Siphonobacter sp. BAB-5385 TaxID=1864822 RepID=UPI000B9E35C5|nr:amidoligase family protein [Siphonobacter sp. BAB-5385]OZI08222.1 amidoligase enzyme [Siphonobacter sp. BAB-5385]
MNTQVILTNNALTKTEKIRQLLALGLSRREVADLTGGNYGFVQNVFAKYWPERVTSKKSFTFTTFNRKFGIEIEAHGVNPVQLAAALRNAGIECRTEGYNHTTRNHWKTVSDGSVQGTDTFELVSPILEGLEGLEQVKTVCRVLSQLRAKVNKTCGLHIHFDAEGFGIEQMKNTLINYAHYEGIIDSFMPLSRREDSNRYCQSVITLAGRVGQASTIRELINLQHTRFQKINLQAYLRHQTIEFRQHSGTVEFEKISNWILFLHNLVEYSKKKQVTRAEANFESLQKFQQPEIINYLQTRINQLAA